MPSFTPVSSPAPGSFTPVGSTIVTYDAVSFLDPFTHVLTALTYDYSGLDYDGNFPFHPASSNATGVFTPA